MQTLEINREIIMEKDTLVLGLSVRETVCAALGVGATAGGYLLLESGALGRMGGSWLAIAAGIPFFLFGFFKKNGLPFEKYAAAFLKSRFLTPAKRPVSYPNAQYDLLVRGGEKNNGKAHISKEK